MFFILGIIVGLLVALIIVSTMIYFKNPIVKHIKSAERLISSKGPKPKGFIYIPPTEEEEARERIIEINRKRGKDTPLSDLQSK